MRRILNIGICLLAVLIALCSLCSGRATAQELFVASHANSAIYRYDGTTGAFLNIFVPDTGNRSYGLAVGPDGNLYVSNFDLGVIRRYSGATGALLDTFNPGIGILRDIKFGPDGLLYVVGGDSVARYNALTDSGLTIFAVSSVSSNNFQYLAFGPSGDLYVSAASGNDPGVRRFDGKTGADLGVFIPAGSGGLSTQPNGLAFGSDGNLLVADPLNGNILRFNGTTGAFINVFASAPGASPFVPVPLVFGPDSNLYVGNYSYSTSTSSVLRFNGTTGAFIDTFVSPGSGGMTAPLGLAFRSSTASQSNGLQIGVSDQMTWVGNSSEFTVNIKNIGTSPQTITSASVTGTTWAALESTLPVSPLQPGDQAQLTFSLAVPNSAIGGAPPTPALTQAMVNVTGSSAFTQKFQIGVYNGPATQLQATVVDASTTTPLANALVAVDNSAALYFTDANGNVTLNAAPGLRTVFAYASNHLPAQQTTLITASSPAAVTLSLQPGQALQVSSVSATQLTPAQIAARGINLSDPNNYFVYDFQVSLQIGSVTVPSVVVPAAPTPGTTVSGTYTSTSGGSGGGGGGSTGPPITISYSFYFPTNDPTQRVESWIIIPGDIRVLKQFWDATVVINNNSSLSINGVNATLGVPVGLSLPALNGAAQSGTQSLGSIAPMSKAQADWVVRGDIAGQYQLTGTATGSLQLGGASVPLSSALQSATLNVIAPQLQVAFDTPTSVIAGQPFTLGIDITNESPIALGDVQVDLSIDRLVNCALADVSTKDAGEIAIGSTAHVSFTLTALVSGIVQSIAPYVSPDPSIQPPVTVDAGAVNAVNDTASTLAETAVTIPVLANDVGSTTLTVASAANGLNGTTSSDGTNVTYTPDEGFSGTDVFTYTAQDSYGNTGTGTVSVTVSSPAPGISSLSPASALQGSVGFTLTVNGSGFVMGSQANWNGSPRTTTFISPTELQMEVLSSDLVTPEQASVGVSNSAPGGGLAVSSIAVIANTPVLSRLSPSSALAGGPAITLTVTGSGFFNGDTVNWNGTPLTTTFVSATTLKAAVTASDIANVGSAVVTVAHPASAGGSSSNAKKFTISFTSLQLTAGPAARDAMTGIISVPITLNNKGYLTVANAVLTKAILGSAATTSSMPLSLGSIPAGSAAGATLTFPGSAGASGTKVTLSVSGTYTGGKFTKSVKVALP